MVLFGALISVSLTFVLPVAASCARGLPFIQGLETVPIPAFSYNTTTGPLNWHNLNSANFLCANGTRQSPILLNSTSTLAPSGSVTLNVPIAHNVTFENQGTNVEVITKGTLTAANQTWDLAQFHFHSPSEHRVDLGHFDGEVHFVFAAADGSAKVAVLAFFIEASTNNSTPFLETIFSQLDEIQTPGTSTEVSELDFSAFQCQANSFDYYNYMGSLTTPPCTEGVSWFISTTPIPLQADTYSKLKNTVKTNNRYTQNLLGEQNILQIAAAGL